MTLLSWIKVVVLRPPPSNGAVFEEVEREKARLNGEIDKLIQEVNAVKNVRAENRSAMADMLDETLDVLARGSQK